MSNFRAAPHRVTLKVNVLIPILEDKIEIEAAR